jgi:hypothetical protein
MGKPKKQFSRPSVTIQDNSEPRRWRNVLVKHLALDDIVNGYGKAERLERAENGQVVVLVNVVGTKYYLNSEAVVYAFTSAPEADE